MFKQDFMDKYQSQTKLMQDNLQQKVQKNPTQVRTVGGHIFKLAYKNQATAGADRPAPSFPRDNSLDFYIQHCAKVSDLTNAMNRYNLNFFQSLINRRNFISNQYNNSISLHTVFRQVG